MAWMVSCPYRLPRLADSATALLFVSCTARDSGRGCPATFVLRSLRRVCVEFRDMSMVPPAASTRALIARNTSRACPVTSPQIHALLPITTGASAGASLLLLPGAVTAMDASPPLVLDQRHHLGGKALHPLQRLLDGGIGTTDHHVHHHVTDTHLLVAFDVVSDLRGRAREGTPLPAGEPLGFLIIVPAGTIRQVHAGRIATRVLRIALHSGGRLGELLRGPHGEAGVAPDGIPGIGKAPRTAQRRRAFTTHPDGRVRLLHRL